VPSIVTTQDVAHVQADRGETRSRCRVVDEYDGDTLSEKHGHLQTTAHPGELEPFFNGAWSIFDVLEMNFRYGGYDPDELRALVVGVKSRFYPQMGKLYKWRIEAATR
jgi:hypothetical protein